MTKKYFGTDGIRGEVNSKYINGDMFFKFGLASGTYFKSQKKRKQIQKKKFELKNLYDGSFLYVFRANTVPIMQAPSKFTYARIQQNKHQQKHAPIITRTFFAAFQTTGGSAAN